MHDGPCRGDHLERVAISIVAEGICAMHDAIALAHLANNTQPHPEHPAYLTTENAGIASAKC